MYVIVRIQTCRICVRTSIYKRSVCGRYTTYTNIQAGRIQTQICSYTSGENVCIHVILYIYGRICRSYTNNIDVYIRTTVMFVYGPHSTYTNNARRPYANTNMFVYKRHVSLYTCYIVHIRTRWSSIYKQYWSLYTNKQCVRIWTV